MGMMPQGAKWDKRWESGCDQGEEATRQPMTSCRSRCSQLQTVLGPSRQRDGRPKESRGGFQKQENAPAPHPVNV